MTFQNIQKVAPILIGWQYFEARSYTDDHQILVTSNTVCSVCISWFLLDCRVDCGLAIVCDAAL